MAKKRKTKSVWETTPDGIKFCGWSGDGETARLHDGSMMAEAELEKVLGLPEIVGELIAVHTKGSRCLKDLVLDGITKQQEHRQRGNTNKDRTSKRYGRWCTLAANIWHDDSTLSSSEVSRKVAELVEKHEGFAAKPETIRPKIKHLKPGVGGV